MLEAGGSACQVIADGTFFKEREGQHMFNMWQKKKTLGIPSFTLLLCRDIKCNGTLTLLVMNKNYLNLCC